MKAFKYDFLVQRTGDMVQIVEPDGTCIISNVIAEEIPDLIVALLNAQQALQGEE